MAIRDGGPGLPVRPLARRARTRWRRPTTWATPSTRSATRCSAGSGVREALRELLRRGTEGRRGLDELRRSVRERLRKARTAGRMDGTLQEVRELLDKALDRRAAGAVPRSRRRRAAGRGRARRPARGHRRRRPRAQGLPVALRGGPAGLRPDPGPAAPGGARQLVRLDEAGAGERHRGRHAGGQGHGRRPVAAHRRAQPRRGHRRSSSASSWTSTASSSRTTRSRSRS